MKRSVKYLYLFHIYSQSNIDLKKPQGRRGATNMITLHLHALIVKTFTAHLFMKKTRHSFN